MPPGAKAVFHFDLFATANEITYLLVLAPFQREARRGNRAVVRRDGSYAVPALGS